MCLHIIFLQLLYIGKKKNKMPSAVFVVVGTACSLVHNDGKVVVRGSDVIPAPAPAPPPAGNPAVPGSKLVRYLRLERVTDKTLSLNTTALEAYSGTHTNMCLHRIFQYRSMCL